MKKKRISYDDLAQAGAQVISLARNPKNLSPAIDAIVARVKSLRMEYPTKKIVMIFGEEHSTPSHVLLPMGILSRLYKSHPEDLAVSLEIPHNHARTILEDLKSEGQDIATLQHSLETDESGQANVSVVLNYSSTDRAPYSNHTFGMFCQQKKLSVCFSDVATDDNSETIDLKAEAEEPCGAAILEKMGIEHSGVQINMENAFGVAIRNMGMQTRTLTHATLNKKPIVALRTGAAHVFGNNGKFLPLASLSYLFHHYSDDVICMPVMPMGGGAIQLRDVSPDALPLFKNGFVITDMLERRFNIRDGVKEIVHLENILKESGFITTVHP
jgi:hypothetical protein